MEIGFERDTLDLKLSDEEKEAIKECRGKMTIGDYLRRFDCDPQNSLTFADVRRMPKYNTIRYAMFPDGNITVEGYLAYEVPTVLTDMTQNVAQYLKNVFLQRFADQHNNEPPLSWRAKYELKCLASAILTLGRKGFDADPEEEYRKEIFKAHKAQMDKHNRAVPVWAEIVLAAYLDHITEQPMAFSMENGKMTATIR